MLRIRKTSYILTDNSITDKIMCQYLTVPGILSSVIGRTRFSFHKQTSRKIYVKNTDILEVCFLAKNEEIATEKMTFQKYPFWETWKIMCTTISSCTLLSVITCKYTPIRHTTIITYLTFTFSFILECIAVYVHFVNILISVWHKQKRKKKDNCK